MNLFSSQLLMWRGSSDEQEDGGEGCDVWSASPEAGVELLHGLLDPRAPRRELGRRLRVEGVRGHRDGVLGGAMLHHHLVDHVEVAPRRRVVLVAAVLLELRRRDAAADGLWRGAVRELWRGAVDERESDVELRGAIAQRAPPRATPLSWTSTRGMAARSVLWLGGGGSRTPVRPGCLR